MNQMAHEMPNLIGINKKGIEERIKQFYPNFMGLMNINGMGEMFEMYGSKKKMEMGTDTRFPSNLSPIGSPGPFGVIEMGGMFTIFKVRDNLTSYNDPGWYQHPEGTIAEAVNIDELHHILHHANKQQAQMDHSIDNSHRNLNNVSWFSKEKNEKELHQGSDNWMQSKPEDSMGGHMMHGMGKMEHQGMAHDERKYTDY